MSMASTAMLPLPQIVINSPGREVTVSGMLGVATVTEVRAALQRVLDAGHGDLVLHLGEAEVRDASGLGVLVGLHQRARRRGRRLVIAEASERLERLLAITKLHVVLARVDQPGTTDMGITATIMGGPGGQIR